MSATTQNVGAWQNVSYSKMSAHGKMSATTQNVGAQEIFKKYSKFKSKCACINYSKSNITSACINVSAYKNTTEMHAHTI